MSLVGLGCAAVHSRSRAATRSTDLVNHLVDDYTVVTYDRRGLSRSSLGAVIGLNLAACSRRGRSENGRSVAPVRRR